ncbi:hypothetical protein N7462_011266 [Penicillium macrosclerotiorum]|uniref:uncharacterized protein n=1 Tax=Penicillium macrosclerotiorum TaxID=303699 RepID=UPI002549393E|nr:uncharacterized protein N7462_011266 [Penicillium macrosclerotiorum]KAJ5666857.1 hypothetical protein N7462_011266 [Penicillium macrosclerotiorum]
MSDVTPFITALGAAQNKERFTSDVQDAAQGIDANVLKAAIEAALAMNETDTIADEAQSAALKAGFEFATKLVMMLKTAPGPFEKKDLYVNFKIAKGEILEKPGMFDMVKKQLYNEWEKVKHYSAQKCQALYIQHVNTFIEKYSLREE